MKYDHLLSVGCQCQVAYQIRRFTGDTTSHFFDWLYTPIAGLLDTLETDFQHIFEQQNLEFAHDELCINRTVRDKRNGLDLFHSLPKAEDGGVRRDILEGDFSAYREKFSFLASRWLKTTKGGKVLFVRHIPPANVGESKQIPRLRDLLSFKYPDLQFDILMLETNNSESRGTPEPPRIIERQIWAAEIAEAKWPGDAESWDKIFRTVT